ncbi:MAG: T9SS type A sorting domain-containing protein [Bacteroidales bacterium]|nr:T9SS type A sorting domain-containing protein [Bacteroidales bacterium]
MKKVLLILLAVGIGFYSFGQKATKVANTGKIANAAAVSAAPLNGEEIASGPVINSNPTTRNNRLGLELIIGHTKYDCQTNCSMAQRMYLLSNGKMPAVYTFANSGTPWNDRGTFYNLMTGAGVWSPYPIGTTIASMLRVEAVKIGWANYAATNNEGSELIVAHNGGTLMVSMYQRATLGVGNWSEVTTNMPMEWPRVAKTNNGNTVHVIGTMTPLATKFKGVMQAIGYTRSTDAGATWSTLDVLPGLDSTVMKIIWAERYAIDAKGSTVAVVAGGYFNDAVLFKSTNNGTNWSKTIIYHFPNAPFDPDSTMPLPTTDTIPCFDGAWSCVVDGNGKVHVWGGMTMFNQTAVGAATTFYWPQQCGMIYWRDDMATLTGDLSVSSNLCWPWNYYVERNGNTIWDVFHAGWINMGFNVGGTSMPSGSIGTDGKLYVVFQHMSDADPSTFHIYGTDTVPYRHLFALSSTDNGATWSDAVEITPFDEGRDYVFPSVVTNTTDSLRVLYQEDDLPGTSLNPNTGNPHPSGYECDIVYLAVPVADLVSTPNKNKEAVKVTLYPNPANEYTNITFTLAKAGSINLSVINIMGQKVASYKIGGISGKNNKQINTGTLASGIYVVKIEAEGKVYTEKLIVN